MKNIKLKDLNKSDIISMVNEGNADAINELGIRYFHGEGFEKDEKKAFELFNKASEKNCINAKFNLALCYLNGAGTEKNETYSFNILKELAEKYNYAKSYYYLGELYYLGRNPQQDDSMESFGNNDYLNAFIYFNKSLQYEKNTYASKCYLGEMYMLGRGIEEPNVQKAKMLFLEILNQNPEDAYAYYKLALIYSGDFGLPKDEEKSKKYFNKIECDLCIAIIYYFLAVKPDEEQTFDEFLKLLNSEMENVKNLFEQIPLNHPAREYYNRLLCLKKEEYNNIVERLKDKILIINKKKKFKNAIIKLGSHGEVINLAKHIVKYTDSLKNNKVKKCENNKKLVLKFYRDYSIDDDETCQFIVYDKTEKVFTIEKNTVLNIPGNHCNTKIVVKNISDDFVELEIEDSNILTIENIYGDGLNILIEKGKSYDSWDYSIPSGYRLLIEIM